jgi:glycosyltransferase involved in cell wall biosynthesis
MALGKAIVAPAQPNIFEILTDEKNAILFDPQDPEGLRKAIERLAADVALRKRIGEAARQTIQEKGLTWDNNAARVVELFLRTAQAQPATVSSGSI